MEMVESYQQRHYAAMLNPETPGERIVSGAIRVLEQVVAAAYDTEDNFIASEVAEPLGHSIIGMTSAYDLGRLDAGEVNKHTRKLVAQIGGDAENL